MEIKGVITGDIIGSSQIRPEFRVDLLTCLTTMEEELHGISDEYLSLCQNIADKLEHERKPALPKYVAFGRYLYESIHTNTQIVEEDNEEYNEFEQMLNDFINSEFSKLTDKSDNK